jgi:pimeloyl-ACP methyl ester carboxylesterase
MKIPSALRIAFVAAFTAAGACEHASAADLATIDRLVSHVSTVPAIASKPIDLFVREKVIASVVEAGDGKARPGSVVLFVHGGYSPSTLAFDVPYRDYSWMEYLARAGFDVFAMDMTGYGRSGHPMMDDPCNLIPGHQKLVVPKNIPEPCLPKYPFELVSSDSETADIDAVVDFIRKLRGVDKITLIGWSGGGIRTGTYTVRNPDKVEKLIILASSNYNRKNPDNRPEILPRPGAPMSMQVREVGINQRWLNTVKCENQVEPGMPEYIWKLNIDHDPVGATWGTGGLRAPTRTYWGWNAASARKITVPTLVMVGEQDDLLASNRDLYEDLGSQAKVLLGIGCATHFVVWERQRRILHRASLEWLQRSQLNGASSGQFRADADGRITAGQP